MAILAIIAYVGDAPARRTLAERRPSRKPIASIAFSGGSLRESRYERNPRWTVWLYSVERSRLWMSFPTFGASAKEQGCRLLGLEIPNRLAPKALAWELWHQASRLSSPVMCRSLPTNRHQSAGNTWQQAGMGDTPCYCVPMNNSDNHSLRPPARHLRESAASS